MGTDFAKLHRAAVFVESPGKIIWQPRIGCWLSDRRFAVEPLPEPYGGMSLPEIYFDETFPVSVLKECVHRIIELFAPKLVLGISDEISSTGDTERVRVVAEIVDGYNARLEDATGDNYTSVAEARGPSRERSRMRERAP